LSMLVEKWGTKWQKIATELEGNDRSGDECSDRWKAIDPKLNKGAFSEEEDASLRDLVQRFGRQWKIIAEQLVGRGRSDNQCKGRWRTMQPSPKLKQPKLTLPQPQLPVPLPKLTLIPPGVTRDKDYDQNTIVV